MKNKIVGYGEVLLRLTPIEHGSLVEQSEALKMGFAGAEANIIADLALLGHPTSFVTTFPDNPIGRKANQFLQSFSVNTDDILWNKGRLGSYYIEHGSSIRGSRVTYDRADSLITKERISSNYWETIFTDANYFILTGITPALSQICIDNIQTALFAAKKLNVKVVFDLNFRRTLWSAEEAKIAFNQILPFVDILIGNIGSAFDVFGIQIPVITDYESLKNATIKATEALTSLGNFESIAMTMRLQQNANDNILGGMIFKNNEYFFSNQIPTLIVDRLGGGDAFVAAILHGIIKNWPLEKIINFANAAFACTQTINGDVNYFTENELLTIASGSISGHVQR